MCGFIMSQNMIPADRQNKIKEILSEKGIVKVNELSKILGVSELTIRRDLSVLEKKGILERTHGGAVYNQRMRVEPLYEQKHRRHTKEKQAIGKLCSEVVEDGDTLLINSGSTTREVMHYLKDRNVRIITSNIGAIFELHDSDIELILIGGLYRRQSNSLTGIMAKMSLERVYGSKAIIGVDGISVKYGLTTPILEESEIARMMIDRTPGEVIVVADHSKIGVVSNFITAPLDRVNMLITDNKIDPEYKESLENEGIKVLVAPVE